MAYFLSLSALSVVQVTGQIQQRDFCRYVSATAVSQGLWPNDKRSLLIVGTP